MNAPSRGMTLIEAIVGAAIMLVVFLGIFAAFQISLDLVFSTRAATSATALVNERMEYVRGLNYDAIGTVGGIPAGTIPQVEQTTLNGVPYTLSTLVQYVDDPTDGLDALDETGVTADYKLVRVSAHWTIRGLARSTFALTRIAPKGIETLSAGGTLRVNVFDTATAPVSGAVVRIVNNTVSAAVNLTVTTGTSGCIGFPGAPPGWG
ncbi:prepilin-type N-terminal cleavage/methylation domain-containing protein, partial [Patescibacteria group bacterium]|nr:prepilin-type N-terminal cleavage/methylation domain-containing protein [Patescibacteria group bacterium]